MLRGVVADSHTVLIEPCTLTVSPCVNLNKMCPPSLRKATPCYVIARSVEVLDEHSYDVLVSYMSRHLHTVSARAAMLIIFTLQEVVVCFP